jgi:hypothetical protein
MLYVLVAYSLLFSLSLFLSLLSYEMRWKISGRVADATLQSRVAWAFVFEAWVRESSLARAAYVVRRVNYSLANLCFFCFKNSFGGVFGCNNGGKLDWSLM